MVLLIPLKELGDLALRWGICFHVDLCLGGFVLPFARKLGYPIPPFDFTVQGVTSISVDIHKYGLGPKGTSAVLYQNHEIRKMVFLVKNAPFYCCGVTAPICCCNGVVWRPLCFTNSGWKQAWWSNCWCLGGYDVSWGRRIFGSCKTDYGSIKNDSERNKANSRTIHHRKTRHDNCCIWLRYTRHF
eukprot:Gb_27396 [translate_table: standard]